MDNRETSPDNAVFEYTGIECSVPKDVIIVRVKEGVHKIEDSAFSDCESLEIITLPSTLVEIGNYAFINCRNLREVIFNDGLQKIGEDAFENCSSLKSVTLPSTLTEIGFGAFSGCSNLREVIFNDGLQKIGGGAFYNCSSLQSITLPSSVTEIGNNAFWSCSNLKEVTFNEGLKKIETAAFLFCKSLESITLPSTVIEIGNKAFCGCKNLREITFNEGLQKIGHGALFQCSSLESISLPSTVTEIGIGAFEDCSNLRKVKLNGNPIVKREAFRNCALERILFPNISYRLENIIQTIIQTNHSEELENKVNEVRGVVQWESNKLFLSGTLPYWNETKRDLGRITRLVSYYELKYVTTIIELALWKSKLDQADVTNNADRAAYRIDVPGPVKDTMLQYLDNYW